MCQSKHFGVFDALGTVILVTLLFSLMVAGIVTLLNWVHASYEADIAFILQTTYLTFWGFFFRGIVNAFVSGFRKRWRETHERKMPKPW